MLNLPDLVRGCRISHELLNAWSERFVFPLEPVPLSPELDALLPPSVLRLRRSELSDAMNLDWHDAYRTWTLSRAHEQVALLTPAQARSLPAGLLEPRLRFDEWRLLRVEDRQRRLLQYVEGEVNTTCLSGTADLGRFGPVVAALAGTFAQASGPNCFATALAAIMPDMDAALGTAGLWLHQAPFIRALERLGYTPAPMTDLPPERSIVAFADSQGVTQHACCYLGAGLVLNKNARSWWQPRQVLPLSELLKEWAEDGLSLSLFTPPV